MANASSQKLAQNQLLADLIQALGAGTGSKYRDEDLRYERVIVMTDADVDGAHIASLLITFFYQEMPALIENGHLFLAVPPLYKLTQGAKSVYARDEKHKRRADRARVQGQPEGRDQPLQGPRRDERRRSSRRRRWTRSGARCCASRSATATAAAISEAVNALMGSKPEARFRFIQERAAFAQDLDI